MCSTHEANQNINARFPLDVLDHIKCITFNIIFFFNFQLQILNLGNNEFEELPEVLEYLTMLEKLHLFNNRLRTLSPKVLSMGHILYNLKTSIIIQ